MNAEQCLLGISSYCQFQRMTAGVERHGCLFRRVHTLIEHDLAVYKLAENSGATCLLKMCNNTLQNVLRILEDYVRHSRYKDLLSLVKQAYSDVRKMLSKHDGACNCPQATMESQMFMAVSA
ncbi:hypothetical protein PT277_06810 [Acetobacteraceae bacterium ESL0709]|nr:hypothetical protein [Acetobacteraceae bacterium ESL0697]MDF7678405.1 hypothetical protein [Acetobacteraceae bacterium ESL0709]